MAAGVAERVRSVYSAFGNLGSPQVSPDAGIKFGAYLSTFFDRDAVTNALTEAEWVVLSKFGAYLRQRAMTSIRKAGKKGKPSTPGTPPRSHDKLTPGGGRAEHLLRTKMFFGYDAATNSTVVGPAAINKPTGAPSYCEHGGKASRPKPGGGFITVTYPKRPYMAPALAKEAPRFPQLFKGVYGGKASVQGPGG